MLIYLLAFITLGTLKGLATLFFTFLQRVVPFHHYTAAVIPSSAGDYGCWSQESLTSIRLLEQELEKTEKAVLLF